jgi:hypothetical protein
MRNQYKVLAEKYEQVLEAGQEPVMTVNKNGVKEWKRYGKHHRLDGPAIEWANGRNKEWWQNGKHHRLDGPAIDWPGIAQEWWQNGKRHRLDGPALEWGDGTKSWFINGKYYSENEFNKEIWNRNPARRNILKKASGKAGIEMDI